MLIGVEDGAHRLRGVDNTLDLEERIANLISDTVAPRLVPDIEILPWRRTQLLAVQVHPSQARPHYIKREGLEKGVYVRVGSTNRRADAQMVEELRRFVRSECFDEQPMPDLDSEAVDFLAASESFESVRKLSRRDLDTLHLLANYQGRKVPTVGGDSCSVGTASGTSPTHGSRRVDSEAPTRVTSSTGPNSTRCR